MGRKKKSGDKPEDKRPKAQDPGTLIPGRGADFHKPDPEDLPSLGLPIQPAGGEQFGTLRAGGLSDPAPPEPLPPAGGGDTSPIGKPDPSKSGGDTLPMGQSPIEANRETVTVSGIDSSVALPPILRTLSVGGVQDEDVQELRKHLETVVGYDGLGEAVANTADLDSVLNIRRHIVQGKISGIVPVPDESRDKPGFGIDTDRPEYDILSELARGGMGIVYTAVQTSLNRRLVIKTLKPQSGTVTEGDSEHAESMQEDRKLRDMFVSEAVITANLVHPNIVPVHDLGQTEDGKLFYSMKRVDGVPWHHRIADMSLEENLDVLLKVADGVAFAHYNGVVNRDLKPENVAIGRFGEVAVLDWGLSHTTAAFKQRDSVVVHTEGFGGSPGYMAPEQVRGVISEIGYHTDIYLLGATLFQVVTGRAPHQFPEFQSLNHEQAIQRTLYAALNNDIVETEHTGELIDIAKRAMASEPEDRFATVEDFQNAIREYRITGRAEELLKNAKGREKEQGYADYQGSVALYDEAVRKWPENARASEGLTRARTQYAELAHRKGDYDLGLEVVSDEKEQAFKPIRKKLKSARARRGFMKTAVAVTTVAAFVGFAAAGYGWWESNRLFTDLEKATGDLATVTQKKDDADRALALAETAKQDADIALGRAKEETTKAIMAKNDATMALSEVEREKDRVEREKVQVEAEKVAAQDARDTANMALVAVTKEKAEVEKARDDAKRETATAVREKKAAELAKAEAQGLKAEADFNAWRVRLSAATTAGDYAQAIAIIEEMLADKDDDGDIDNELAAKNYQTFKKLLDSMQQNVTQVKGMTSAAVARDGRSIVVAEANEDGRGSIRGWGLGESGLEKAAMDLTTPLAAETIVSGRSGLIAMKTAAGVTLVNGDRSQLIPDTKDVTAVRFSRDSKVLVIGDARGVVSVFAVARPNVPLAEPLRMAGYRVSDVEWLVNADGTGHLLMVLSGGRQALCGAIPFRSSGRTLELPARAGDGTSVMQWAQLQLPAGDGLRPRIAKLHLSRDQQRLALTTSDDGSLVLLPRDSDAPLEKFPFESGLKLYKEGREWLWPDQHAGTITHVAFSADGSRMVTAADDATIRAWKVSETGISHAISNPGEENLLKGHSDSIASLGFLDASNEMVVSTSLDQSLRVWNLATYVADRSQILRKARSAARLRDGIRIGRIDAAHQRERRSVNVQFTMFRPQQRTVSAVKSQQATATPIRAHVGEVSSVAFSKDGARFVTAGQDQTTRVWESKTGRKSGDDNLFEEGHAYNISNMHFLPDGQYLVTTSYDGTLLLWDTKDDDDGLGREVARLAELGMSNAIALAPDGSFLVTSAVSLDLDAGENQKYGARLYRIDDLIAGRDMAPKAPLFGSHTKRVSAIAISPDSSRIVTADRSGEVAVWRSDGTVLKSGQGVHDDGVSALAFISPDEIITAGFDGKVRIWSISADGSLKFDDSRFLDVDLSYVWRLRVSPDQKRVLTSGFSQEKGEEDFELVVEAWDLQTAQRLGELLRRPYNRDNSAEAYEHDLAWSPRAEDQEVVVTVGGELRFHKTDNWTTPYLRLKANSDSVTPTSAAYSPGPAGVLATADGRTVHLWELDDAGDQTEARHAGTLRSSARVAAADFSSDGKYIITGSRSIRIYDSEEADGDSVLRIEESKNPNDPRNLVHGGVLTWAEFTPEPDSYRFVTSGLDSTARIWDWAPGKAATGRYLKHDAVVSQARWSPDGKTIVTTDRGGKVRLWDANDAAKPAIVLPMPDANASYDFTCCSFAPASEQGRWVVAGGRDRTHQTSIAIVWDLSGDEPKIHCVVPGRQHGNRGITATSFTADGLLITGGRRGGLIQWAWRDVDEPGPTAKARMLFPVVRLDVPKEKRRSTAHRGAITSIAVAADGTMATSASDGVLLWHP